MKVGTIFSGIGAFEQALVKCKIKHEVIFACDNGERELDLEIDEIDALLNGKTDKEIKEYISYLYEQKGKKNFVKESYCANYKISSDSFFEDVRFFNGTAYQNKIDIIVGGSPCQSFSISGKRGGLEDTRGTLFYEYARIVGEVRPKVFIYENVPGLLSHDKGKTWEIVTNVFDDLGYNWKFDILNSRDYGIPQNRKRVFVVGFRKDLDFDFEFPQKIKLDTSVEDYLDKYIENKYYHGTKGFKWITSEKSLKKRVSINSSISRTQAANQQFNWCGDMRFERIENIRNDILEDQRIFKGYYRNEMGVARKLTPRECLRLMGFSDNFKIVVPDQQMYRQSGNSIVVNVLENIIMSIIETGVFNE